MKKIIIFIVALIFIILVGLSIYKTKEDSKNLINNFPLYSPGNWQWSERSAIPDNEENTIVPIKGTVISTSTTTENYFNLSRGFYEYYDKILIENGYEIDNQIVADGVLGRILGYKNGKHRIILYSNTEVEEFVDIKEGPKCPCYTTLKIYEGVVLE